MKAILMIVVVCFVIMISVSYPPVQGNSKELQQIQNTEIIIEQNKTVTDGKLQQLENNLIECMKLKRR